MFLVMITRRMRNSHKATRSMKSCRWFRWCCQCFTVACSLESVKIHCGIIKHDGSITQKWFPKYRWGVLACPDVLAFQRMWTLRKVHGFCLRCHDATIDGRQSRQSTGRPDQQWIQTQGLSAAKLMLIFSAMTGRPVSLKWNQIPCSSSLPIVFLHCRPRFEGGSSKLKTPGLWFSTDATEWICESSKQRDSTWKAPKWGWHDVSIEQGLKHVSICCNNILYILYYYCNIYIYCQRTLPIEPNLIFGIHQGVKSRRNKTIWTHGSVNTPSGHFFVDLNWFNLSLRGMVLRLLERLLVCNYGPKYSYCTDGFFRLKES